MQIQSLHNSNYPEDISLSSNKKKLTTPALIFCKSHKQSNSKILSENNSALINTNRSPLRMSNAKSNVFTNKSPLINKSNVSIENKSSAFAGKSRVSEQSYNDCSVGESVRFCENHQTRAANFVTSIDENNIEYYCQKCAILLASQGYSVEKISQSSILIQSRKIKASRNLLKNSMLSQKSSKSSKAGFENSRQYFSSLSTRKLEIQNFLLMTKGLLEQIEGKKEQLKQNLIQSQEFYGQQIEDVNEYFQLVYKSLQLQKNKCYNYILNQRVQVEKPIRLINDTISELKQKIQGIIQDIQQNIQTVYQTTDEIYRPVIQQYQQNYQDIHKKISQIEISEVEMRKIDFEGVPQSIFYLSDILKQSIQQNYQIENNKKLNEQLNSLKQSLKQSLPKIQPKKLFSKRGQIYDDTGKKSNNKFCFSFEGQALQAQLQQQKIIYQSEE